MQAFTGGFASPADHSGIAARLASTGNATGADALIIGWNAGAPYDDVVSRLHGQQKEVFLWLPVFSEYGDDAAVALDYSGERHKGAVSGADDDFTFACPAAPGNIGLAAEYYDRHFGGFGFDGVFLDKIRFSSFAGGFRSGMGCFCQECRDFYESEGVDTAAFVEMMESGRKDFLVPSALHGMRYAFEDPLIDSLFRARARLITASVRKVADMFRQRGLKVGLDVFAPPLSYWVGQDCGALGGFADFIKPMIYRVTDAPAGIPYELRHMKAELTENGCDIGNTLEKLWGTDDLTSGSCFVRQLESLEGAPCPVYPGVEVNRAAFCGTDAAYVESALEAIGGSGMAGCVLSWNVLADTVYP